MPAPIEFYFDFSSPYSYLALQRIEDLGAKYGRSVVFKPMLLGVAFKASGMAPLVEIPLKGEYSKRDFARSARFAGVPYKYPSTFPIPTVNTARVLLWLQSIGSAKASVFVHRAFRAYFVEDRNINDLAVLGEIADELGIDKEAMAKAVQDPAIKEALKTQVDEAIRRGIFGVPFMFVDGEPFWGNDRLPQIERWLASGPF
ncbi:MAG TPA: 2-hydroxychromene-2-carboxylate isomerase [Burkholderiaceae bacterium]|nr:2-hydroxychromene-2-carboxylate isomerase [Burkholderiaceae bacterium]